jgi:hypothetical protein
MFYCVTNLGNICEDGYALAADNTCTECNESSGILAVIIIFFLLILFGLICYIKRQYLLAKLEELKNYFTNKTKNYDLKSFRTKGKILFSFFQIISALPTALNLVYPDPFSYTLEYFSLSNINLISLLSLGCVFSSNFYNKLR